MALDQWLILNVPGYVLCLSMVIIASLLAIGGSLFFHHFIPHSRMKVHNDIAGPIFSTLGVVYAVLLAFVMVVIWQKFDRVRTNAEMEVYYLADISVDAEPFEASFRQEVRNQIRTYARALIDEWDMLSRGQISTQASKALEGLDKLYSSYTIRNETEKVFFEASVGEVNNLLNLRILRLIEGRKGIHPLLWFILIAGGLITIAFTIFFGSDSLRAKILMSTFLAILIALILFTILDFSFPFAGNATVSVEAFKELVRYL